MSYTPWDDPSYARALELHREHGLIDLHVDSIIQQRLFGYDVRREHRALMNGQPLFLHADVPRMIEGGYGGAALGIHFWPWDSERGWRECNAQIDYLDHVAELDERVMRVRRADDWRTARRDGLLGLAPGVEGAHMLNGRVERVAELAARGAVYLTLAHFSKNAAATPGLGRGADETSGLTSFGVSVVEACNRHGVAVDVAHVNAAGVLDACRASRAPVFCTHTGARALSDSPRNLTDEAIDAVAATGGAIGIILGPNFLAGRVRHDSSVVVEHIEYVARRVGVAHLCIGSDFDGWLPSIPTDHRDCRDLVKVTQALLDRGWSEQDVTAMLRDNTLRVLDGVEAEAA